MEPRDPQLLRSRSEAVRELALTLGFDRAGVARAEPTSQTRFLRQWVARGYAGELDYITHRVDEREDPRRVLDGARSVVSVGLFQEPPGPASESGESRVARYAGGDDYHDVMSQRLAALASGLEALAGVAIRCRIYVDTGPVQERAMAAAAGLGWIGKNTCLIDPDGGSHLMLGVLLTDLELQPGTPLEDHCGTCRACLDACPTQAFPEPYVLDATRCLSYTTIELEGSIPEPLRSLQGDRVFGCDICQDVCPWNQRSRRLRPGDPLGLRERMAPRLEWQSPSLEWLLGLTEDAWRRATRRTALRRTRHRGLLRNALVAAGNSGDAGLRQAIQRHAGGKDPLLAEHARWALKRLDQGLRARSRASAVGASSPKMPSS